MFKKDIIGIFFAPFLDNHTIEVAKNSIASLFVKIIGTLLSFLISIFLGKTLGSSGLGILNLANRIVTILSIIALFGLSQVIVKEIAISSQKRDLHNINSIIYSSIILNISFSIILSGIVIIFSRYISIKFFHDHLLIVPMTIFVLGLIPQNLSQIYASGLIGYGKIWQSTLFQTTFSTLFTMFLLISLWLFNIKITILTAALAFVFGRVFVTIILVFYWKKVYPYPIKSELKIKKLIKKGWPLFQSSIGVIMMNSSDMLMLGFYNSASDVGIYSVSFQLSQLARFILIATNSSISPKIASLYESKQKSRMKIMINKVNFGLFAISLVPFLIYLIFGHQILLLWGKDFISGYSALLILSAGQVVNITLGTSTPVLIMCGYEKSNRTIIIIFTIANLIIMYFFIIHWGVIGAAIATSLILIARNVTQVIFIKYKMNLMLFPNILKNK